MKKLFHLIFVLLSVLTIKANPKITLNGSSHLTEKEFEALTVNGSLKFDSLIIKNQLVVNGSISGKNLTCKTIKSNGSCDIDELQAENIECNGSFLGKNIKITENSALNGSAKITSGALNNIKTATSRLVLEDTKVNGNILFKKANNGRECWFLGFSNFFGVKSNRSSAQTFELRGQSLVAGDIVFEEDGGEVHLFDNSQIKGKVVNAKIIQK